jgi:hypothetical protein
VHARTAVALVGAAAGALIEQTFLLEKPTHNLRLLYSRFSDQMQIWPLRVAAYRATPPSRAYRGNDQI